MSNSEDKLQKTNGLGTDPMQRLASLKTPRDLSLGGIKPNKKVFIPNLNVARNKNKGPTPANSRDQKKDEKGRKDRRNDRNKNFNKNGPNLIKSSGVFSEGLGSAERHTTRFSYGRESSDSTPSVLKKPTIRVKDLIKIDKELEDQKIDSVLGTNIDDEIEEDFKQTSEKDAPIKLPMDAGGYSVKSKPAAKVKQEVVVKKEPKDDVDCFITTVDEKPLVGVKKEVFEDTDVVNVLRNDKPTLILLQLPDSLPGRGGSMDDEPRRKNTDEPSTSTSEEKSTDNKCRLAELEEGKIGKLLIHRSGRVSLALGDTIFESSNGRVYTSSDQSGIPSECMAAGDHYSSRRARWATVCSGTKAAFHQEVVSLAVDETSRSANLVALGAIQHKLNLVPDWEAMFHDMLV